MKGAGPDFWPLFGGFGVILIEHREERDVLNRTSQVRPAVAAACLALAVACSSDTVVAPDITPEATAVAALIAVDGNGQIGAAGAPLGVALRVKALDPLGNPVRDATVTFTVMAGGGSLAGGSVRTGSDGVAVSEWTLGPVSGVQSVTAHSATAQALFTATACLPTSCPELLYVHGGNIYRFETGTGESQQLTFDGRSFNPAWSPDGQRIAFAKADMQNAMAVDVYLMNADGSAIERVTSGLPFHSPAWSPDGKALALAGDWWLCVYQCAIYVLDLTEAGNIPQVAAPMGTDPAWSPDGMQIAFVSLSGDDGYHALYLTNAGGGVVSELVARGEGAIDHPAWSPDGQRIAFGKCHRGTCDIFVLDIGQSQITRLTNLGDARWPSWSADGTRIAFSRWGPAGPSVEYVAAAGGNPVPLVAGSHSPAWRP
jgi:TolB protein